MDKFFQEIAASFQRTFINDDRWLQFLKGLGVTVEITVVAAVIGIILGFLIAMVRSTYDKNLVGKKCRKPSDYLLKFLNVLCNIYITVIRGTPVVIQLMIMYYIIFSSSRNGIIAAVLAFGINSGAYVAEIVRSGIMSIDKGQFEASRSLGFNYSSTMLHVILPQAFKTVLPALANECIVLLKETSVAGYIAIQDLTKGGDIIRSQTFSAFMPLITVALIYLIMVVVLTHLVGKLERRLSQSDRR